MTALPPINAERYASLIESALRASPPRFIPRAESDDAIQVERGMILSAALVGAPLALQMIDRLVQPHPRAVNSFSIVDQLGHRRPAYRGLLVYAALQALAMLGDNPTMQRLRPWAELIAAELTHFEWPSDASAPLPATRGAAATGAAWNALALFVASNVYTETRWRNLAVASFDQFVRRQLPGGSLLAAGLADNPETHWYHELVILHALASFAIQTGDATLVATATRNAAFHQAETQPDHATHQPWGLPAFLLNAATHPLADQLLHSATALPGAGGAAVSGITSILLADALYCLRLLLK